MWLVLLLNMIGATGFTVGKLLLSYLAPIFLVGIRMSIAGLLLLLYHRTVKKGSLRIRSKDLLLFTQIVFVHIYGAYVLEFWALNVVSSVKTSFLYNLNPFVTALLAYFFLRERMSMKKIIGLVVGFVGCIPMLLVSDTSCLRGTTMLGIEDIAIVASVICFAQGWIVLKKLMRAGYTASFINGFGMLFGGLCALITSWCIETKPLIIMPNMVGFYAGVGIIIACFAWLIMVSSILYYNFYGFLLRRYSATFLAFTGFLSPLFAALLGWFFLGEHIGAAFFVSCVITVIGLYLFYQEELASQ